MATGYSVIHYRENGKDIFEDWLKSLKDKRATENGNFGEHKPCREGVWELIIDFGPGYRVYYSITEKTIVLLLCAGDKRTQQKDIDKAIEYLKKYKERYK